MAATGSLQAATRLWLSGLPQALVGTPTLTCGAGVVSPGAIVTTWQPKDNVMRWWEDTRARWNLDCAFVESPDYSGCVYSWSGDPKDHWSHTMERSMTVPQGWGWVVTGNAHAVTIRMHDECL